MAVPTPLPLTWAAEEVEGRETAVSDASSMAAAAVVRVAMAAEAAALTRSTPLEVAVEVAEPFLRAGMVKVEAVGLVALAGFAVVEKVGTKQRTAIGGFDVCLTCGPGDGGMGGLGGGAGNGGHGGFGGGGGAGYTTDYFVVQGGDGGFGGGGGATPCTGLCFSHPGKGGAPFGGNADDHHGGGGGALGGAIFAGVGYLTVRNSTFFNNFVTRGEGGGGSADKGADAGGAIFSLDSSTEINQCTFSGNQSAGSGGAVVIYSVGGGAAPVFLTLWNTIIANNGADECYITPESTPPMPETT